MAQSQRVRSRAAENDVVEQFNIHRFRRFAQLASDVHIGGRWGRIPTYTAYGISGDPAPSAPDMQVTRLLREGAKAVDIALIDHVVIGRPECDPLGVGHYSFRSAGIL